MTNASVAREASIRVNGETEPLAAATLADLLAEKAVDTEQKGIAVALNGAVVPRAAWPQTPLKPGDSVEIAECRLESVHAGEIVLARREGRFFLHRFLNRCGEDGFVLRGDSMSAPDPIFAASAFQGKVILIERAGRAIPLPVPLRPWSRALGLLFCYSGVARRLGLKVHNWRTSQAIRPSGTLAKDIGALDDCRR